LPHQLAIANTGSTANFGIIEDAPVLNKCPTLNPITIQNPNGSIMTSADEAELDLPMLPPAAARHIHIIPDLLASSSLISMGQLCNAGCSISFTATEVTIWHPSTTPLSSLLDTEALTPDCGTFLCQPLLRPRQCASILCWFFLATIGFATPAELVVFAHIALFSPALSTLHAYCPRQRLHHQLPRTYTNTPPS
jgi:hypothetical protein